MENGKLGLFVGLFFVFCVGLVYAGHGGDSGGHDGWCNGVGNPHECINDTGNQTNETGGGNDTGDTGDNQTGDNQTGGNETGDDGNQTGGDDQTGGNETGDNGGSGNETGDNGSGDGGNQTDDGTGSGNETGSGDGGNQTDDGTGSGNETGDGSGNETGDGGNQTGDNGTGDDETSVGGHTHRHHSSIFFGSGNISFTLYCKDGSVCASGLTEPGKSQVVNFENEYGWFDWMTPAPIPEIVTEPQDLFEE